MNSPIGTIIANAAENAVNKMQQSYRGQEREEEQLPFSNYFIGVIPFIKRILYIACMFFLFLSSSIMNYALFYNMVMPAHYAREPIYFDYNYRPHCHVLRDVEMDSCSVEEGQRCSEQPTYGTCDDSKAIPTATIHLLSEHTQWSAHIEDVAPPSSSRGQILKSRSRNFLHVSLLLPESDINKNLGMFMLEVDLLDNEGLLLARSTRSAMLPYESRLINTVKKLCLLVPLVLGAIPEARRILVKSFDHYIENRQKPLSIAVVRLVIPQQTQFPMTDRTIQVHSAELRIGKEHNAFQALLDEWFFTCALLGTMLIMILEIAAYFGIKAWIENRRLDAAMPQYQQEHENNLHENNENTPNPIELFDDLSENWEENISPQDHVVSEDESQNPPSRTNQQQNNESQHETEIELNVSNAALATHMQSQIFLISTKCKKGDRTSIIVES